MANPGPNRVKLVKANVERLEASVQRLRDQCGHWSEGIMHSIEVAQDNLFDLRHTLDGFPDDYVPPRKSPVRSYTTLKIGDHVRVTERAVKSTPKALVGCAMEIIDFEGEIAHVKKDGVMWAIKRSALKLAE